MPNDIKKAACEEFVSFVEDAGFLNLSENQSDTPF